MWIIYLNPLSILSMFLEFILWIYSWCHSWFTTWSHWFSWEFESWYSWLTKDGWIRSIKDDHHQQQTTWIFDIFTLSQDLCHEIYQFITWIYIKYWYHHWHSSRYDETLLSSVIDILIVISFQWQFLVMMTLYHQ